MPKVTEQQDKSGQTTPAMTARQFIIAVTCFHTNSTVKIEFGSRNSSKNVIGQFTQRSVVLPDGKTRKLNDAFSEWNSADGESLSGPETFKQAGIRPAGEWPARAEIIKADFDALLSSTLNEGQIYAAHIELVKASLGFHAPLAGAWRTLLVAQNVLNEKAVAETVAAYRKAAKDLGI